jgi:hypothetical protein
LRIRSFIQFSEYRSDLGSCRFRALYLICVCGTVPLRRIYFSWSAVVIIFDRFWVVFPKPKIFSLKLHSDFSSFDRKLFDLTPLYRNFTWSKVGCSEIEIRKKLTRASLKRCGHLLEPSFVIQLCKVLSRVSASKGRNF